MIEKGKLALAGVLLAAAAGIVGAFYLPHRSPMPGKDEVYNAWCPACENRWETTKENLVRDGVVDPGAGGWMLKCPKCGKMGFARKPGVAFPTIPPPGAAPKSL